MDPVVPHEITAELTQILSNLVLGDNEIRSNAEKAVNERLASTPDLYLLALAQFAISADTDVMRSFSLVLLRRLLFRPVPHIRQGLNMQGHAPSGSQAGTSASGSASASSPASSSSSSSYHRLAQGLHLTLYDHLSTPALHTLENLLLHSLLCEPSPTVRRKAVDTVADVANEGMKRGRPWHRLQGVGFGMAGAGAEGGNSNSLSSFQDVQGIIPNTTTQIQVPPPLLRTSAYELFSLSPLLISDLSPDAVVSLLLKGLRDSESLEVRNAAVKASVGYLQGQSADSHLEANGSGSSNSNNKGNVGQALMYGLLEGVGALARILDKGSGGSLKTPGPTSSSQPHTPSTNTNTSSTTPTTPTPTPTSNTSGSASLPPSTSTSSSQTPTQTLHLHLSHLTPLASSHPSLFLPHLSGLLGLLPSLVLPSVESEFGEEGGGVTPRPGMGMDMMIQEGRGGKGKGKRRGGYCLFSFYFRMRSRARLGEWEDGGGGGVSLLGTETVDGLVSQGVAWLGEGGLHRHSSSSGSNPIWAQPQHSSSPSHLGGGDHNMDEDLHGSQGDEEEEEEDDDFDEDEEQEDRQALRLAALEFMLSLCEARPGMFKVRGVGVPGRNGVGGDQSPTQLSPQALQAVQTQATIASTWISLIVRACLEGMSEIDEDVPFGLPGGLEGWLGGDPSTSSSTENDSPPALYEQSLDRIACAMGGRAVLPPAFQVSLSAVSVYLVTVTNPITRSLAPSLQTGSSTTQYIPAMLASYDWRARHAGLMAIAAIGEGTGKVMVSELGKIVGLVIPMFRDNHPRVRYAACQCVGQLCTDLEEIIQEQYHQQLFSVLIPALEDPEPRVHSHAAAALINFCEGVERDTLVPYLDPIVERLLRLLNPAGNQNEVKRYVQEQAITTLAMVADASETVFAKHYATIMPLLLNVLRNADGPEYRRMRVKAMECAGLIAIAVGRDTFRPDAITLVELLIRIQKSPIDPQDTQLSHYLMGTWAKICQAMGVEFEPYLPVVMPDLLATASAKADVSVYDDEDGKVEEREGWETVNMDGQTLGIRTSAIEEKCQAFETMVIYASTLQGRYAPYLAQSLEVTLPALRFYFHDGVREACAMLIPMLIQSGHVSSTLTTQMVSATLHQLINIISDEHDASFLASLFKAFTDCVQLLGGPSTCLSQEYHDGIIEATKRQLHIIAQKRRAREAGRASRGAGMGMGMDVGGNIHPNGLDEDDREDLALLEEMEDFALEDMGKMLKMLDPNHELLVAVGSVRELGMNKYLSGDEDE
ncbi:hypothetical protein D9758_014842 [Tetrapyrgos nigripes]|uniref:Importin subunit beta-1/Transportin-1-like TPR repeats domain-containing protein n=1 Tax=Tetrapyrgos nigripes TaxID=182062 RepID=A0A8H5CVZ7_9AGAR|nr:hypothetical protein D9758_014842 [Tetrapyrgos nigripes]